jgi:hypothetical protein
MAKKTPPEFVRDQRGGTPPSAPGIEAVIRQCEVCDWEGEVIEALDADPDCPWCHAPTRRTATLARSEPVAAPGAKNPHAAALGRLGGLKGGRARAEALTPAQRRRIASRAARARWDKARKNDD